MDGIISALSLLILLVCVLYLCLKLFKSGVTELPKDTKGPFVSNGMVIDENGKITAQNKVIK